MTDRPELMTAREVAAVLHVSVRTLKKWGGDRLPYISISERGDRRYRRVDVERLTGRGPEAA